MTKPTSSKVVRREGSIAIKKDGTKVKMITAKLAYEDYLFVVTSPPNGLGMGITNYLRGKIEEDMAKHSGVASSQNFGAVVARDVYIKNKFYNDIYDRIQVAMTDIFEDQGMNRGHLRTAISVLERILSSMDHTASYTPNWEVVLNDVSTSAPTWFEARGNSLRESAVNASDLLIVMLKFFTRVNPSVGEVRALVSTLKARNYFDKMDDLKVSESAEANLAGTLMARDDSTRYQGWEDDDVDEAPWELE